MDNLLGGSLQGGADWVLGRVLLGVKAEWPLTPESDVFGFRFANRQLLVRTGVTF